MDNSRVKTIVEILMDTEVYFDLSLNERYRLVRDISNKCITPESSLMSVLNLDQDKFIGDIHQPRKLCY
jgi:hypothetical protein